MSILIVVPNPSVFKYVIDRALPVPIPKVIDAGQSSRVSSSSGANGGGGASNTIFKVKAGPISGMYPANGIVKTCELEVRMLKGRDPSLCVFVYSQEERVNWTLEGTNGVFMALTPMIDAIRRCMESPEEELVNEDSSSSSDAEMHRQYAQLAGERAILAEAETRPWLRQLFGLPAFGQSEPQRGSGAEQPRLLDLSLPEDRAEFHRRPDERIRQPLVRPQTPPRIVLGLPDLHSFTSMMCSSERITSERLVGDVILYRASITPGITSDDYVWCFCSLRMNTSMETVAEHVKNWVSFNGDEAHGVVLDESGMLGPVQISRTKICTTVRGFAFHITQLTGHAPDRFSDSISELRFFGGAPPPPPPAAALSRAAPPPAFHTDRIDLSTYDPDDRVAIEALLDQDRRDGVLPPPSEERGHALADFRGQSQRFVELTGSQGLTARLTDSAYVDLAAEEPNRERQQRLERSALQRRENSLAQGLARDARIREMRAHRTPEFRSGHDRDDEDRPRLQRPAPLPFFQTHARPRPPPEAEPTRYYIGGEEHVGLNNIDAAMGGPISFGGGRQGLVVGARPNNRLRDQVAARANARTARQIVEQATADVKKQIEPRLKKNDDVDASALTADDNSCVICTSSHVTTMLFPCLHYQFCSGCIAVWKDEQKHEGCPVCRAKIEMVLQPMGKISLEDLRARNRESSVSSAPVSSGIVEPVPAASSAAPAPAPSAKQASNVINLVEDQEEAKEPPAKKGRASKRKPAPKKKK